MILNEKFLHDALTAKVISEKEISTLSKSILWNTSKENRSALFRVMLDAAVKINEQAFMLCPTSSADFATLADEILFFFEESKKHERKFAHVKA